MKHDMKDTIKFVDWLYDKLPDTYSELYAEYEDSLNNKENEKGEGAE